MRKKSLAWIGKSVNSPIRCKLRRGSIDMHCYAVRSNGAVSLSWKAHTHVIYCRSMSSWSCIPQRRHMYAWHPPERRQSTGVQDLECQGLTKSTENLPNVRCHEGSTRTFGKPGHKLMAVAANGLTARGCTREINCEKHHHIHSRGANRAISRPPGAKNTTDDHMHRCSLAIDCIMGSGATRNARQSDKPSHCLYAALLPPDLCPGLHARSRHASQPHTRLYRISHLACRCGYSRCMQAQRYTSGNLCISVAIQFQGIDAHLHQSAPPTGASPSICHDGIQCSCRQAVLPVVGRAWRPSPDVLLRFLGVWGHHEGQRVHL